MLALQAAQQNFAVSDPSLPDNPIISAGGTDADGPDVAAWGRNVGSCRADTDRRWSTGSERASRPASSVVCFELQGRRHAYLNQFGVAALRGAGPS